MSATNRFFLFTGFVLGCAACSSDEQAPFSDACTGDASAAGCGSPQAGTGGGAGAGGTAGAGGIAGSGGTVGTGGAPLTGGAPGSGGTAGGAGAGGADQDAGGPPPVCSVTGGGPTLTPTGYCTVLAYCDRTEFRLVCRIGGPTCDCRTKGVTQKTIQNNMDFCAPSDAGTRSNIDEANAACGWNLDTSMFNH